MNRPREDWPRLASYVISARIAAGYKDRQEFSAATGITARTLGKLETGHPVSPETLAVVERWVNWRPDSARLILAGGEPVPVQAPEAADRKARAQAAEEFLASLSPEDVQEIAERFIEAVRSRAARDEPNTGTNGTA